MRLRFVDVLRLGVIASVSFVASYKLPDFQAQNSVTSVFNLMFVLSFLAGYFINRALERRKTVTDGIEVELTRLRRLWNMAAHVSHSGWGELLRAKLKKYHAAVAKGLFGYAESLDDYRAVNQMVYGFQPATPKDAQLYGDMLATSRDIGLERHPMERALESRMTGYSWAVLVLLVSGIIALLMLNRGQGMTEFSVGATTAGIIAVMDLLYRTDNFSKEEIERFEKLYRVNIPQD